MVELHGGTRPESVLAPLHPVSWENTAARLHAYVDGLTLHASRYPEQNPPEAVRDALSSYLATLTD
nr:TetR family transcriptional regulator C-terminal domain-containing protein [Saccharomonospora cyanea]